MAAIFKSSLQNLSLLPTSLKIKPLFKPETGLSNFSARNCYFKCSVTSALWDLNMFIDLNILIQHVLITISVKLLNCKVQNTY